MKGKLAGLFAAAILSLTFDCACAQSQKSYRISDSYTELSASRAIEITYSSQARNLVLDAPEELHSAFQVELRNGILKLWVKDTGGARTFLSSSKMRVTLPASDNLKKIRLSGACNFMTDVPIGGHDIEIDLSGASRFQSTAVISGTQVDMKLTGASRFESGISATRLGLDCSGASHASLSGKASLMEMELSGASQLDGDITVSKAEIDVNGASHATFKSNGGSATGSVSGASSVEVQGLGSNKVQTSGASTFKARQ